MKNILLFLAFIGTFTTLSGQTELKINPIGALFSSPDLSVEFAVSENIGIEPTLGISWDKLTINSDKYKSTGFGYGLNGKYYFSPDKGIDKFYAGLYLRGGASKFEGINNAALNFNRNRLGAGLSLGYKFVSKNNIVFDIGAGIGRKIFNKYSDASISVNVASIPVLNLDGFFKLAVGYRFGGSKS